MAKSDFLPTRDGDLDSWEDNFLAKYPSIATSLGIDAAEQTNTANIITDHRTTYSTAVSKKAESKSAHEDNNIKKKTAKDEIRRAARNAKSRPGYTEAMGDELGINGPEVGDIDIINIKPVLKVQLIGGSIRIEFQMNGTDGITLNSKRGIETDFSFLAIDTNSPYDDNRPNLESGKPEKREYYAYYMLNDQQIGQQSDVVGVVVG